MATNVLMQVGYSITEEGQPVSPLRVISLVLHILETFYKLNRFQSKKTYNQPWVFYLVSRSQTKAHGLDKSSQGREMCRPRPPYTVVIISI